MMSAQLKSTSEGATTVLTLANPAQRNALGHIGRQCHAM